MSPDLKSEDEQYIGKQTSDRCFICGTKLYQLKRGDWTCVECDDKKRIELLMFEETVEYALEKLNE